MIARDSGESSVVGIGWILGMRPPLRLRSILSRDACSGRRDAASKPWRGAVRAATMSFLVDVIQIESAHADEYLQLVRDLGVPVMTAAGAALVAYWSTARDHGEDVDVLVAWS